MNTAVFVMFLGLFVIPWVAAGLIHPPAAWLKGTSRWKVLLYGCVAFMTTMVAAALLVDPARPKSLQASDAEVLLGVLWLLTCIVWPFTALVLRTRSRAKAVRTASPEADSTTTPQPKAALGGPTPEPNRITRAISTGWSIGEVEFKYEDSEGNITHRRVTVHSVNSTYLKGECHDRQSERTFRLDRIIGDLVDCDTGEILSPEQWAQKTKE